MTAVTITRHYSGFANIADKLSLGNTERDGNASVADYNLPDGYELDGDAGVIRGVDGYECEIVLHSSGRPQLISRAGKISAQPVLSKV